MRKTCRLENWSVITLTANEYQAPELGKRCLAGEVFLHPLHEDGKFVYTTPIKGLKDRFVETASGSLYELINVDPIYERQYPNAKHRLFLDLANK